MKLTYRPEIDGLRALAVITVVLFHAKAPGFDNGYLGVDIFFVISGYLITSIIVSEHASNNFSYGRFVMRRVRRILPALVVVMLASIPFAYWLLLPDPLENFGQSLVATIFSANNILLWLTSGYWDLTSDFKPLLHTWSLGVEEQFYIFYPLLLVLILRLRLRACYVLLAFLIVLSFVLMVRIIDDDPSSAFYLLHYRAWQLLIGAMAGLLRTRSGLIPKPALSALGLALILAALFPAELPIAAALAMATCGTAAYLLWASSDSLVTWVFTRRSVVFVGLISYSFYLWHQPVFAFMRVAFFEPPSHGEFALGILLAFGLAVLSWRYVEVPFRSSHNTGSGSLLAFVGAGLAVSVTAGLTFHFTSGFPHRLQYSEDVGKVGMSVAYNERIYRLLPRNLPEGAKKPVVLVAGNSFARDFSNVLLEAGLGDALILLYRDDLAVCPSEWTDEEKLLVASLDTLIYASGNYASDCLEDIIPRAAALGLPVYFGGKKHFGSNLNPLLHLTPLERTAIRLRVPKGVRSSNNNQVSRIGDRYINIMAILSEDGGRSIRVTNDDGVLLTTDRVHFSEAGAIFLAERLPVLFPEIFVLAYHDGSAEGRD